MQSGGKAGGDRPGKRGGGGRANQKGSKKGAAGGKGARKGKGGGGGKGGAGKKESPTAGLLELRRAPGSPAVLVGRNNLQNERITFSLARAHELWLHARGVAGAHVLLRLVSVRTAEWWWLCFCSFSLETLTARWFYALLRVCFSVCVNVYMCACLEV